MKIDDLNNKANHDKPLWVVYGHDCFPSILCCKLKWYPQNYMHSNLPEMVCIWGFSIYRRSPGFRTLGVNVDTWMNDNKTKFGYTLFEFYDDHGEAIERIRNLTDPKGCKS